jgi:hypothetical protein
MKERRKNFFFSSVKHAEIFIGACAEGTKTSKGQKETTSGVMLALHRIKLTSMARNVMCGTVGFMTS